MYRYLWLVSLKIGGVSRDGHSIKLAYYLPVHKGGQEATAKPPEAESLASFGNWTDGTNVLQLDEH